MKHDSLSRILSQRFAVAIGKIAGMDPAEVATPVRATNDPRFGDYQCNAAMALARSLKRKPRDIAQAIIDAVDVSGVCDPLEIAGPGFINIKMLDAYLADHLRQTPAPPPAAEREAQDAQYEADRLGIPISDSPQTVVIDYSSPNIAKQMHVGHLRSTIIGDVFARVLGFLGHKVIRQNHIGDWGTAMGMVILGLWYTKARARRGESSAAIRQRLKELLAARDGSADQRRALVTPICAEWTEDLRADIPAGIDVSIEDLELGYQFVQALTGAAAGLGCTVTVPDGNADEITALPRKVTSMLQEGGQRNAHERTEWEEARAISLRYCQELYERLGVLLELGDVCGESFYDDRLAPAVSELREKLAPEKAVPGRLRVEFRTDQGAHCLYFYDESGQPLFKNQDGQELPMLIQKSDGAFLYASTDLAAIRYRIEELGARRLLYVIDARQRLHLRMLSAAAQAVGWACAEVSIEHVSFGSVLGDDRKPLKTREGENVKLGELLDEAERRARALIEKRDRGSEGPRVRGDQDEDGSAAQIPAAEDVPASVNEEERARIARRVGIAAVKYADLSRDRVSDYVFSWDNMLAMQGNTAPYMMYAYARIRSIYRKAAERFGSPDVYADNLTISLSDPTERALALRLARLPDAIELLAGELSPHTLCTYLYDLASDFMRYYEACPVLRAADEASRLSRMRLSDLTARSLKLGLGLLGIEVIERM